MLNKYLQIAKTLNYTLFIIAVCMLPFPTKLSLYTWGIWLISWVLEGRFLRKENLKWHKGLIPLFLLAIWVLCEALSYTWSIDKQGTLNLLFRHVSFWAVLPLAVWGVNEHYDWRKVAKYFVLSSVVSICVYGVWIYVGAHWDYVQLYHQLPEHERTWTYYGEQVSDVKHRLYYGTVLNLAVIAWWSVRPTLFKHGKMKSTIVFFCVLVLLVSGIVLSGSRANLLALLALGAMAIIVPLKGRLRIWVSVVVLLLVLGTAVLLFTLHPRFSQIQVKHIVDRKDYPTYTIEPRINIWHIALQEPENYIWHGVGAGGNAEYLKPFYASKHLDMWYERQFDTHNQYLATLIDLGIFATIFFVFIWLCYPFFYQGRLRQLALLVGLLFALNLFTENMLDRIDGVITVCCAFLTIALLARSSEKFEV